VAMNPNGAVLLHGFTGSPASFDAVVEALPATTPVLRPTLLGHGRAGGDAGSFEAEVDRLAAQVGECGFRRPALCGYSLGGRVGLGLLARHPSLFARAVIVAGHSGLTDATERAARIESDERWANLLEQEGIAAFVDAWERQPLFANQAELPEAVQKRQREMRLAHDPSGLARALRVLGLGRMPDLRGGLRKVTVPVTLVVGEADAKFRSLARSLADEVLGGAEVRVIPGSGHNVVLEAPRAVARAIAGEP
jgi:2-succinyl-6-hydroxy-2,4-cyclohexadiene-1-carboxylate synthase